MADGNGLNKNYTHPSPTLPSNMSDGLSNTEESPASDACWSVSNLSSNMSDGLSDTRETPASDACWSINNQQGDPYYYPRSPEYVYSAGIDATEMAEESEEVAGCTHCMEVSMTATCQSKCTNNC